MPTDYIQQIRLYESALSFLFVNHRKVELAILGITLHKKTGHRNSYRKQKTQLNMRWVFY